MTEFTITVSIPFGISRGTTYETKEEAQAAFDAAAAGTYPDGTDVTFWTDDETVQVATVTAETKAAARATEAAALNEIIKRANERAEARIAAQNR